MEIVRRVVRYAVLAGLAALLVYIMWGMYFKPAPVKVGGQAPDFSKVDLAGQSFSMSQNKGKVVVLNFFATWCDPCVQETPDLVRFNQTKGSNVEFIMVDRLEQPDVVKQFVSKYQLNNRVIIDSNDSLSGPYGLTGQPETFIIDSQGIVRVHQNGPLTYDELTQLVAQYQ
ncbi:MAG: alkyl hydroperoxide reductase/Thiol specific antioxidant/Mal allergen [Bacilli bacterium]|nr:alkyl hydroperoxide reductase/Thiol specific antioxidant/Mal allergen [Bacilli bacterium]